MHLSPILNHAACAHLHQLIIIPGAFYHMWRNAFLGVPIMSMFTSPLIVERSINDLRNGPDIVSPVQDSICHRFRHIASPASKKESSGIPSCDRRSAELSGKHLPNRPRDIL